METFMNVVWIMAAIMAIIKGVMLLAGWGQM